MDGFNGIAIFMRDVALKMKMNDRLNAGRVLLEKMDDLIQYLNQPIMVVGYRVSTNRLTVVKWKVLADK